MPTNLVIYLVLPPEARLEYERLLAPRHPELSIRTVGTIEALDEAIADADILLSFGPPLRRRPDLFRRAPRLKWVQSLGTGVDGIIDSPSLPDGVIVTATRGIHGPALSEMALLLMLALSRDLPRLVHAQDRGVWDRRPGTLLDGATVGILGVGLIAADLAPRCKAMGMRVIGISRTPRTLSGFDAWRPRSQLIEVAGDLDHLVLLLPLDDGTRGIVGAAVFAAMKPTAYLVNIGRGGLIDDAALIAALTQHRIAGAALDTFREEPLPPESPLWRAPNLIITPHSAGFYDRYAVNAVGLFEANLAAFLSGDADAMRFRER